MKKKKILLYIILLILVILSFILGQYLFSINSVRLFKENKVIEKVVEKDDKYKIDTKKDLVYDAFYKYDVTSDKYSTENDTYYVNDIVVPYINIKSDDASKVNKEIKDIFTSAIDIYKKGITDKISYVEKCNYKSYYNDDILSIVIEYSTGENEIVNTRYYTYNFNLKTYKLMNFEELYNSLNISKNDIDQKIKSDIIEYLTGVLENNIYQEGENFDTYLNGSIDNYNESIVSNSIKFYRDSNDKLNIFVKLKMPIENGEFERSFDIK